VVRFDDLTADRQAQAGPAYVAVKQAFDAKELLEHQLQRVSWDAYSVVFDADLDGAASHPRRHANWAALRTVLSSIRQQICQHLLDAVGFGQSQRQAARQVEADRVPRIVGGDLGRKAQQRADVGGPRLDDDDARLHPLQV